MKELLLIRHAKSSWENPDLEDIKRPLNPRGLRDGPYMAAFCREIGLIPDTLISSPAVRAFSTAEFFFQEFIEEVIRLEKETDLYFGSESDWLHIINEMEEKVSLPAFFSHNPTITYFANKFTQDHTDNVPTCGVVHLQSIAESWADLHYNNTFVKNFYFPKELRKR